MINKIFKLIIFVIYFVLITVGFLGISSVVPAPENEILFSLELLLFLILWFVMVRTAYKRVFGNKKAVGTARVQH